MNTNLLRVLILEPLQLLACLIAVESYNLKLRQKLAKLGLHHRYLTLKNQRLVEGKRKTLAEYVRHRNLFQCVSGNINESHNLCGVVMPNIGFNRELYS